MLFSKPWKIVNHVVGITAASGGTPACTFSALLKFLVVIQSSIWTSCVIYTKDIIIAYLPQKKMQMLRSSTAFSWYLKKNCYIFLYRSCLFQHRRIIPITVEQSFNKRTVRLWRFVKTAYWKSKMSELITKIVKISS